MKDFFKHLSVYGILPVVGKFIGFFLIPIYARVFSLTEFGILELYVTLVTLLTYTVNLEIYSAIGRFFYDYKSEKGKQVLVSTGLWVTLLIAIIVVCIYFIFKPIILQNYIGSEKYSEEFILAGIWFPLSAISTYLSVLPRYRKRTKIFVLYSIISIAVRVGSTLFYVLLLKLGLKGVLLGHITGALCSFILYYIDSKVFIVLNLNKKILSKILKFALPIMPGLLLIGAWRPIFNYFANLQVGPANLGIFSFALKIISILAVLQTAINLTWKPLVFENYKSPQFKEDIKNVSELISVITILCCSIFILYSMEFVLLLGTKAFSSAGSILGVLTIAWYFNIIASVRGIGPFILNKTKISSWIELISISISFAFLILFGRTLLLISIAFSIYSLIKYALLFVYTSKFLEMNFLKRNEILLLMLLFALILSKAYEFNLYLRMIISVIFLLKLIYLLVKNRYLLNFK